MGKEGNDWIDGSRPECIIAQVELEKRSLVFEGVTDRGQRGGYFGDKTTGKDICKIRDLFPCRLSHWSSKKTVYKSYHQPSTQLFSQETQRVPWQPRHR